MAVLLHIVPYDSVLLPVHRHPYVTPLSVLHALEELLRPISLDVRHDKDLGVQQPDMKIVAGTTGMPEEPSGLN